MVYNRLLYGLCHLYCDEHELRSGYCPKGPDSVVTRVLQTRHSEWVMGISSKPNIKIYPPKKYTGVLEEYMYYASPDQDEFRKKIVDGLHPNPDALQDWMYSLHCRNLSIINGVGLDDPVDLVIYGHAKVRVSGGTKLGVDYAESLGIPTINIVHNKLIDVISKIN